MRDQLLQLCRRPRRVKPVVVDGQMYHVRAMTAGERDEHERACLDDRQQGKPARYRARMLCATLSDEEGRRLMQDEDLEQLVDLPAAIAEPLFTAAATLAEVTEADREEIEGKSESPDDAPNG